MIEIDVFLQCESKTIGESRVFLIEYAELSDSLKHITILEVIISSSFQCAYESINE